MSIIFLYVYILTNVVIFILYYKKNYGIFQTPCLFSIVSLTFVVPQLFQVIRFVQEPDSYMNLSLVVMTSCSIGVTLGFKIGNDYPNKERNTTFDSRRINYIILLLAIIGIGATLMNRGAYKGGFVSGTFVVINFFASYLDYLLITLLVCWYKKMNMSKIGYFLLCLIVFVQIDKFLISARRGEAIQFVLTLAFFYFFMHPVSQYQRFKWIIPTFFVVGLFLNSQIGKYRENAYSNNVSISENIKNLDFSFTQKKTTLQNQEINNAILGINACYENGVYDFGSFNWNGLVKNFVPKKLKGEDFKQSLMFPLRNEALVNNLSKSGSTMTGYYDAFTSFGIFAGIKFLFIGLILGRLWKKSEKSVLSLILYVALMSPSLHSITHSTNNFFSCIVFFLFFVYPLFRLSIVNNIDD